MELDIQSLIHVVETNDHIDLRATAGYLVGAWYVVVSFHYVYQRLNVNLHAPTRQPAVAPSYMWSLVSTTYITD
jgi:hypothetical protein